MIFITGPLYSGKRQYARNFCGDGDMITEVQDLAARCADLPALADDLARRYKVIIATEIGGGIVPVDEGQREARDKAGRLSCMLAERAETVVRIFCGLPMVLKGDLP
ncbi:MAG: bifunctional adenosylcobinamide kinase/adenosylcobinamide-phosphate guanylyltransferase [Clostridia bacterium]|nr:bifunctional adenosylcobinamide kinase/adenosylcobinamide-phosphate guanylyltransferase [Clostridia bacterium]